MRVEPIEELIQIACEMVNMAHIAGPIDDGPVDDEPRYFDEARKSLKKQLGDFSRICADIGLHVTKCRSASLMENLDDSYPRGLLIRSVNELTNVFHDELETISYVRLYPHSRALIRSKAPFGELVWSTFPDANYDIEEAAKCLAFGRYTASVMHCMRALEVAICEIIGSFEDPDFDWSENPTWKRLLDRIHRETNPKKPRHTNRWSGNEELLLDVEQSIDRTKRATRNPSMHAERRYDGEESFEVFEASRALMKAIAKALSKTDNSK